MSAAFVPVVQPEGWLSASPLPSHEALRRFYADLYYQSSQTSSYQAEYGELELRHRALKCEALLHALRERGVADHAEFLDVGAGEGFLMDAADRSGFSVTGLDYSTFGISRFFPRLQPRMRDGDVIESLEALASEGKQFAACSAINVFEHVLDPVLLLRSIDRVLAAGSVIAITVPNDNSPLHRLLRSEGLIDRDFWFAPPQHLHYFNAETLPRFCAQHGFEVVDGFSDFPIDQFLMHPGSNYVLDPANGPAAHRARLLHDLLLGGDGVANYLRVYRALFSAGIGRNVTVLVQRAGAAK